MNEHYDEMCKLFGPGGAQEKVDEDDRKVGVFFCGAPPIGYELADRCEALTLRGREDRNFIEYHFLMEVSQVFLLFVAFPSPVPPSQSIQSALLTFYF